MFALAGYAVRGTVQGTMVASSTLLLSIILPPLVILSSAIVALIWLREGARHGAIVAALAILASSLISLGAGLSALAPLAVVLSCWVPALVMAAVLRATVTLSLAMLSGAALAIITAIAVHLVVSDPAAEWRALFAAILENDELRAQFPMAGDQQAFGQVLDKASELMTGLYCAMLFLFAAFSVLLARAWQARLFNPGGLKREFHALRFGRIASIAGVIALAAAVLLKLSLAKSVAIVVIAVFAFQGMAVVHAIVAGRGISAGWLVLIYFMLILKIESVLVIGLIGLADAWVNFRQRFVKAA